MTGNSPVMGKTEQYRRLKKLMILVINEAVKTGVIPLTFRYRRMTPEGFTGIAVPFDNGLFTASLAMNPLRAFAKIEMPRISGTVQYSINITPQPKPQCAVNASFETDANKIYIDSPSEQNVPLTPLRGTDGRLYLALGSKGCDRLTGVTIITVHFIYSH
ncbi:hypothetical protein EX404_20270 [Salmonella enterica]|nr:hypothetical protein [Salmonella enterica]EBJ3543199.1 hypothetical protein [Salmonella enterica]EBN1565262.1 hypothetical protein [Salmonella enterica]